jgi:polysaccharide export outer membrane protein/exopolysaccharide production protein ExoF
MDMIGKWARMVLFVLALGLVTSRVIAVNAEENGAGQGDAQRQYQLGSQDKVSIKVYEWRPARDEVYEWTAFKAEYIVNSAGSLSLPLLGDVPAAGMGTTELARDLGERLKDRMGLIDSPDVTVEVVQYRPFYIMGAVEKPGEYPYRPRLTILEAYAIAGGKPRSGLTRLTRESISMRGDLNSYGLETRSTLARLARLQAELDNAAEIQWPPEIKEQLNDEQVGNAVKQEQLVFDTRRDSFQTQVNALQQLQSFLEKEVVSLEKQLNVHEIEVNAVKTEFEMVEKLYKKGLTAVPRKLALQRNMAQVDGERLRLQSSLMRARQEISRTKIATIDLQAKRSSEISNEMQKAHARLDELKSRTQTSKNLLYETEVLAPQMLAAQESAESLPPVFKILRKGEALSNEGIVSQETVVLPGDTIRVEQPLRETSIPGSAAVPPRAAPTASIDVSGRLR